MISYLSYVPGIAALLLAAMGYGALQNRVKTLETEVGGIKEEIAAFRETTVLTARIDERTDIMKGVVERMDTKLNTALGALINTSHEKRSFSTD